MKKIQILSALLAMTLLSGCAAPPAETQTTSVNQAMLLEQSAQEQEGYTVPDRFTGDWVSQEGKMTIHADVPVVTEQGVLLPTATVEPRAFTQADFDNLMNVLLKGEPLYSTTPTKQELQESLDYINSPQWQPGTDGPAQTPEQLEARRKELNAWYTAEIAKAPEEKPIIHGFADAQDPNRISGFATVDGFEYVVFLDNGDWRFFDFIREDYKYQDGEPDSWGGSSKEEAIAQANALIKDLGFENFVLDDVQEGEDGVWSLCYAPTVNGFCLSSIRVDTVDHVEGVEYSNYLNHSCSEEQNPDTVSWYKEAIQITMGKDGLLSFRWTAPTTTPVVKQDQTALLPFDEIASIANTMLPLVFVGPKETSLAELDQINGFDSKMDVELTEVSLTLMRIRDKGSLQGTIVPVWDFWGTWDWYDFDGPYGQKGAKLTTEPLLTLNAIDGSVVSRKFGY